MSDHLFIVTYGRTGSTLLLGILNAHPGIDIAGENEGFVHDLYVSLKALDAYERHEVPSAEDTPATPFYGVSTFPFGRMREEILGIIDNFLPPREGVIIRGFKEIRYDMPDLENYLDFLRSRFQDTRFVFLTREHAAVMRSGFYKVTDPVLMANYLSIVDGRFAAYTRKYPAISHHITYEDLLDFAKIRELFTFLGHTAEEALWRGVIAEEHSFSQKSVASLTAKSSLVLFDSAKLLIEASNFEVKNHELKNISRLPLTGIILPLESSGRLESLVFRNAAGEYSARLGMKSPMYGRKFPHNALATTARFSFAEQPVPISGQLEEFELVATFATAGTEVIGRLFISPNHGILPESE